VGDPDQKDYENLAQECDNAVKDGYSDDDDADEWFVCVLHKGCCCFDRNIHSVNAEGEANSMPVERTFSVWKLSLVQQ
jgi:hypothetical protein